MPCIGMLFMLSCNDDQWLTVGLYCFEASLDRETQWVYHLERTSATVATRLDTTYRTVQIQKNQWVIYSL